MLIMNLLIIDRFFKTEIPNAIIERKFTKNVSEYIDQELMKIGIGYALLYNKLIS